MKKEQKFIQVNLSFGQWIFNFIALQFIAFFYILKGAIIFGLFPTISSLMHIFYKWLVHQEYDLSITKEFKAFYQENFWESNKLGWLLTLIGSVLWIDLYISYHFIQSMIIHSLLLILFLLFLILSAYLFPVYARFSFRKIRDYLKQAFFISLSSFIQSTAIIVAVIVTSYIFYSIPFILLFFGIPLFSGSMSWFAFQGILRAEKMKLDQGVSH